MRSGKSIEINNIENTNASQVQCGNCGSSHIERKKEYGHIRRSSMGIDIKRVCGNCGIELGEYRDETMKIRERDPKWLKKEDVPYGPNWDGVRKRVYARDGWCCAKCGEDRKEEDVTLHAHHIKPLRSFKDGGGNIDFDEAHDFSNLITLCEGCHMEVEGKYKDCTYSDLKNKFSE